MKPHPTVLLIDDDTDDQEIFSHAMEMANARAKCVFAEDGINALEKIRNDRNFHPDYIFIDMNMPRMNGQQTLAEIKKIERLKDVPVYMYSTSADPQSLEENIRLGAKDFSVKPSDIKDLVAILKSIVCKPAMAIVLLLCAFGLNAQEQKLPDTLQQIQQLKKLSVDELMNIVVTSVSKTPENISEVASAIQVVTGNDIRRSAASKLPEALRLAPNLQVLHSGSHDWAITARGFNGTPVESSSLADKLLVLIDGRSVYTPLFGGVFWDVQNVFLEDIDRIEVISGPGGSLWGANAVNGVVNIISKNSKDTQGAFASATYGSYLRDHFALRYGGQVDSALFFRIHAQRFDSENSLLNGDLDARDSWNRTSAGFRIDYEPSDRQLFTLQAATYVGEENDTLPTYVNGQSLIGRWHNNAIRGSNLLVQAYVDRTWRDIRRSPLTDEMLTFDLEVQNEFVMGSRNKFLLGAGYRLHDDHTKSPDSTFNPEQRTLTLFNVFVQDQIAIVPDKFTLTVGSKFLVNDYSGSEIQPSVRLAWTPDLTHTLWSAISRNVRTPSRLDVDLAVLALSDHPEFTSEKVISYELGYRMRPANRISLSLATFYNHYDDLRTFNSTADSLFYFGNDMKANTWGFEVSGTLLVSDWWRLRGGFSFFDKEFTFTAGNIISGSELLEALDPKSHFLVQSVMDIAKSIEFDIVTRYVSEIPEAPVAQLEVVPAYIEMNARLGWEYEFITLSIAGQNLLSPSRREFGRRSIPRSVYANIKVRL